MLIIAKLRTVYGRIKVMFDYGAEALNASLLDKSKVVIIYIMPNNSVFYRTKKTCSSIL